MEAEVTTGVCRDTNEASESGTLTTTAVK